MTGKIYDIKTVADFASVPADRLGVCLQEFALWLEIRAETTRCLAGVPVEWVDTYRWKDDGRRDVTLHLISGSEPNDMPVD